MDGVALRFQRRVVRGLDVTREHFVLPESRFASAFVPPTGPGDGPEFTQLRRSPSLVIRFRHSVPRIATVRPEIVRPGWGEMFLGPWSQKFRGPGRHCAYPDTSSPDSDRVGTLGSGIGIRDRGSGIGDSGSGTRDSGLGLGTRGSGFGTRDSGFGIGIRDSGLGIRGSGFGIRGSGFGARDFAIGIWDQGSGIRDSRFGNRESPVSGRSCLAPVVAFRLQARNRSRASIDRSFRLQAEDPRSQIPRSHRISRVSS